MLTSAQKQDALKQLARKRQKTRIPEYYCIHDFGGGAYECDFVSPWSKSACNVESPIMIVAHDWSSAKALEGPVNPYSVLGYDPRSPTNKNLQDLLCRHFGMAIADVYRTNAFPFIKPGGIQGGIRRAAMEFAVKEFLLPQIEIIQPQMVICLGKSPYDAVRELCGDDRLQTLDDAIKTPFDFGCSTIRAVAHTGAWGTNNRGRNRVEQDWALIGKEFKKAAGEGRRTWRA